MKTAPVPDNEVERLSNLFSYNILDTLPEADLDEITQLAAEICGTSSAMISLIDEHRQWVKSRIGYLPYSETQREISFCSHTILEKAGNIFEIPDARLDERFHDNPMVVEDGLVIFYAGVPLIDHSGLALGALCVIDSQPHELSDKQRHALQALGRQVMRRIELHRKNDYIEQQNRQLSELNKDLENYTYIISHDLQSPCNQLLSLVNLLNDGYAKHLDGDGKQLILYLKHASENLKTFIKDILDYARMMHDLDIKRERFTFSELMEIVQSLSGIPNHITLEYNSNDEVIYAPRPLLVQILNELILNAIKYNDKTHGIIKVDFSKKTRTYEFAVTDNGKGFPMVMSEKIFEIFQSMGDADGSFGSKGYGIGLNTVKKLVEKMGGKVTVSSRLGTGSTFTFEIKR
jgi:signal transduction histidine kinase